MHMRKKKEYKRYKTGEEIILSASIHRLSYAMKPDGQKEWIPHLKKK